MPSEAFNGRFWQECLNKNWFPSLENATPKVESWRRPYNGGGPAVRWEYYAPSEFAA